MMMDRENRVKFLKNIGQYIVDNAETILPKEGPHPTKQNMIVSMDAKDVIPRITFYSQYEPTETLHDVEWSPK